MSPPISHSARKFARSTRGRILALLRVTPLRVDDLAARLRVTPNAVRAQIQILMAERLVQPAGRRATASKPSTLYALTTEAETHYSQLYIPFLTRLLGVLGEKLSRRQFDSVMRRAGRTLLAGRTHRKGSVGQRARAAATLLDSFGGSTRVEPVNSHF